MSQDSARSSIPLFAGLILAVIISAIVLYWWSGHTKFTSPELKKLNNLLKARTYECSRVPKGKECKRIIMEIKRLDGVMLKDAVKGGVEK